MFPQRPGAAAQAESAAVRLVTADVRALRGMAVAARLVAAAVDDPHRALDAEVAVIHGSVRRQPRGAPCDIETVVSCPARDVSLQNAMTVLLADEEPVDAAVPDAVSADDVPRAAEEGMRDAEPNPRSLGPNHAIAGDQVAAALFDADAVAASEDPASRDDVPVAGPQRDPSAVSDQVVVLQREVRASLHEEGLFSAT